MRIMSINNGMNTQMGTKWFTFYTKIRPCLALFALVSNFLDFIGSVDSYILNFGTLLYFIGNITDCILCVIVAVKANKDYNSFVRFVKGVLIFEILYYPIVSGILIYYVNDNLLSATISTAILIILLYFIWYRLNINYFRKRIVTDDLYTDVCDYVTVNPNNYISNNEVAVQNISSEKESKNRFCRLCGCKIDSKTKICSGCGKKYFKGINKNFVIIIILSALLVISSVCNFLQYEENNDLASSISILNDEIDEYKDLIIVGDYYQYFTDTYVACVDEGSEQYHTPLCSEFERENFMIYNVGLAESLGYTPCPHCH